MNKVREVVVNHIIGKLRYKILGLRLIDLILVSLKGFIWILLTVNGILFMKIEALVFGMFYLSFFVFILRFILVFAIPILQVNKDIVCFLNGHISTEMIELTLQKNT